MMPNNNSFELAHQMALGINAETLQYLERKLMESENSNEEGKRKHISCIF
jgi:hypothetical protein